MVLYFGLLWGPYLVGADLCIASPQKNVITQQFAVYIVERGTGGRTLVGATRSEEGATALSALLGVVATLAQGDRMALPGHRSNVTV